MDPLLALTPRQMETAFWISQGMLPFEIQSTMGISYETYKSHCTVVYRALGVHGHIHAMRAILKLI